MYRGSPLSQIVYQHRKTPIKDRRFCVYNCGAGPCGSHAHVLHCPSSYTTLAHRLISIAFFQSQR